MLDKFLQTRNVREMPELAEVEFGRSLAERVATRRRIVSAWCAEDAIVFEDGSERTSNVLKGAEIRATHRHGKYIWFALDRHPWPIFHFGMTGAFRAQNVSPLTLESGIRDAPGAWPPRFTKLRLHFDDGGELAFTNARRLGRIRLRNDPRAEPPLSDLGFDPYTEFPSFDEFKARLHRRSTRLKALLLDQRFAAGVGNWLADEMLFQARLDPRRRISELSAEELTRLHTSMRDVVHTAVAANADKSLFPSSWLFHHRWGKSEDAFVEGGHAVEHLTVAGRTTAWVPALQR